MLTTALHDVLNPFTGGLPPLPIESPLALAYAAVERRTTASALASNPITVNPVLVINDGIVDGTTNATGASGLTYTLISGPSLGGKITFSAPSDSNYQPGTFSYLPYQSALGGAVNEQFKILVAQQTQFDQVLQSIPLLGGLAGQVIVVLHQTPVLGDLLAPIIGYSEIATFDSTGVLHAAAAPVAYTYMMSSFDQTPISVNWFPKSGLTTAGTAPTILDGPGLATQGQTDPYTQYGIGGLTPGVSLLRADYNVVTWDPRGEFASGGILQLDSPFFEARDVSSILNWVAGLDNSLVDGPNDPRVGMVGGSYGGGIQLTSAATDPRIDAIVPGISWNSLNNSLYPDGSFKTAYATLLLLSLVLSQARINNLIYEGITTGDLFGVLSNTAQAFLASAGPTSLLNQLKAPTLLIQGTVDVLFTLQQSIDNAQTILANPFGTLVKMIWFCGGHGVCLTNPATADDNPNLASTFAWLNYYVRDGHTSGTPAIPNFQYTDQFGNWFKSDYLPTAGSALFGAPFQAATGAAGGTLGIVPILGGSGPAPQASIPYSLGLASKANNAINVNLDLTGLTQAVGSPTVSFDYQGIGTSNFVYAQLVDNNTGLVVGNLVTPVPVTLDGRARTVTFNMENIVYTSNNPVDPGNLTLQITSSAAPYERFTAFGVINISNIGLTLQTSNPTNITPVP
ncbi:CocE/NonD family hydrolase [Mycolicibacterium sp. P1-5]|uniref:CocE/NonD family hydrolase n=1 Tax=Mycolicibacterium sp. P1-5 TaxID=2024617 RepID=UPI00188313E8|nr:CocE/NonD family hydrolase [Mycolicibacterium sp. P1-5]